MSEKAKETNTKNRNKILSIVYIGVSVRGQMYVEEYHFEGERSEVRESTVQAALALLKKGLEETDGNDEDH